MLPKPTTKVSPFVSQAGLQDRVVQAWLRRFRFVNEFVMMNWTINEMVLS